MVRLELRGRKAYRIILLIPLLLALVPLLTGPNEVNYRVEGLIEAEASLKRAVDRGETIDDSYKEDLAKQKRQSLWFQSILSAPNSVQLSAQSVVTGGSLFALILGALGSGTAIAYGFIKTSAILSPNRRHLLIPYYLTPMTLWFIVTIGVVIVATVGGFIAPSLLDLEGPVVRNSVPNLLIAVAGIWLAGAMWSVIGVSLMFLTGSRSVALIVGVILLICENIVGSFVNSIQPFLPTFGAIELVSVGAPRLYHGLLVVAGGHVSNPPPATLGAIVLIAIGIVAASITFFRFSRTDIL